MNRTSTLSLDTRITDAPASHLRHAYEVQRSLFQSQPQDVQRFLESQSLALARAVTQDAGQAKFSLPDRVSCNDDNTGKLKSIPAERREQKVGGLVWRMTHASLLEAINERLTLLESMENQGIATSAALIRFETASIMVKNLLPLGRSVRYRSVPGEEIPCQPEADEGTRLKTEGDEAPNPEAIEPAAPYVAAARRFYLAQWVAFDEQGKLLVETSNEARGYLASMQAYLAILRAAASLAPYILADAEYQQKRYGILGQLVNQGRALARFETAEIIRCIQRRVNNQSLNRGLSVSLPYFDDRDMELKNLDFKVIPAGKVLFVPAFLVLAVSAEEIQVAHNNWMSASTRQHLLDELRSLKKAFDASG